MPLTFQLLWYGGVHRDPNATAVRAAARFTRTIQRITVINVAAKRSK